MGLNEQALKSRGKSKSTPTVNVSSPNTGPASIGTEIFAQLIGEPSNPSISCAEDSHARTSASPEKAPDSPANVADSGSSTPKRSPRSGRATSSSKMSQPFALADWIKYSGHSLRSGTMRNGIVYPRAPLVPLTGGIVSGLWPTPQARDYKDTGPNMDWAKAAKKSKLAEAVMMWPTPSANQQKGGTTGLNGGSGARAKLHAMVGRKMALKMAGGSLNPTWVEWLMGYPLGWTDLGDSATPSSRKSRNGSAGKS